MKLIKEKLIIVISTAIIFVAVGLYLFLYHPLIKKIKPAHQACRVIERELLQAKEILTSLKPLAIKKALINQQETSWVIDVLSQQGKQTGINFISIKPKQIEASTEPEYKVLPIEMEIESTYKGLGMFLGSLDNLEKGPITVNSFKITPDKSSASRLKTKLVLNLYLAK